MAHAIALRPSEKRQLLKDLDQANRDISFWTESLKKFRKGTPPYVKADEYLDRAQEARKRINGRLGKAQ